MSWTPRDTLLSPEYCPFLLQNVYCFALIMKTIFHFMMFGEDYQTSKEAFHAATFLHGCHPNRRTLPMTVSSAEHKELDTLKRSIHLLNEILQDDKLSEVSQEAAVKIAEYSSIFLEEENLQDKMAMIAIMYYIHQQRHMIAVRDFITCNPSSC